MLEVLRVAMSALPELLSAPGWKGVRVHYHPPFVDRAWRAWGEHRVYLHRIYPCTPAEALFHPHPWPSAMRIIDGRYELAVGYGAELPPIAARLVVGPGTEYEMTDRDAWHFVRPLDRPSLSVMVTGLPWDRAAPKSDKPLAPMDPAELLELFRAHLA
jgi:hypothetical protein